jgi:oligopeptide transport system substrate-binding protein
MDQLFSGLVEVSPDMSVVPDVASSWEVLDNGLKYVIHLRDDVFWSDGVQVTAQDFDFGWKLALDPTKSWRAVKLLYDIKGAKAYNLGEMKDSNQLGVHALDNFTLAVELEGPASYFPFLLGFPLMYPMPRHVVQVRGKAWTDLENIVTNGAFKLADYKHGDTMVLERNPRYHGRFTGNIQRVECSMPPVHASSYLQEYEDDSLDICVCLPPAEWARARQRFTGDYVSGPWLSIDFIGFDVSRPPFNNPLVRRAFTQATDREMLADVILQGYASPATGGFVPPGMPGHSPDIGLPHDPDRARHLLAEAGYPGGQDFPHIGCMARDDPGHDLLCEYLKAHWLEILGVEIDWDLVAWDRFSDRMSIDKPQLWMTGWWADYPDPDDFLRIQWWISPGWENETYDQLVEVARRAMEQEERMRMYQQADRILIEDAPLLPLCYSRFHMFMKPWVKKNLTSPLKWWFWKDVIIEPH